jgi:hypothetical protein
MLDYPPRLQAAIDEYKAAVEDLRAAEYAMPPKGSLNSPEAERWMAASHRAEVAERERNRLMHEWLSGRLS